VECIGKGKAAATGGRLKRENCVTPYGGWSVCEIHLLHKSSLSPQLGQVTNEPLFETLTT
jgi:hypothetical protein